MYGYVLIGFVIVVAGLQSITMFGTLSHAFSDIFNIVVTIK
jgi:hypothetical protein